MSPSALTNSLFADTEHGVVHSPVPIRAAVAAGSSSIEAIPWRPSPVAHALHVERRAHSTAGRCVLLAELDAAEPCHANVKAKIAFGVVEEGAVVPIVVALPPLAVAGCG